MMTHGLSKLQAYLKREDNTLELVIYYYSIIVILQKTETGDAVKWLSQLASYLI